MQFGLLRIHHFLFHGTEDVMDRHMLLNLDCIVHLLNTSNLIFTYIGMLQSGIIGSVWPRQITVNTDMCISLHHHMVVDSLLEICNVWQNQLHLVSYS
jgi:hypothetical protein